VTRFGHRLTELGNGKTVWKNCCAPTCGGRWRQFPLKGVQNVCSTSSLFPQTVMTEDYTPSICIEPPQDDERALMYDDGLFPPSMYQSEYSSSGCGRRAADLVFARELTCCCDVDFPSTNYSMNESCPTAPPALFIQQADSSSELSPLDEVLFLDINYRSSISGRSSPIEAYSPASSCSGDRKSTSDRCASPSNYSFSFPRRVPQ
jgi:hypothetical protein